MRAITFLIAFSILTTYACASSKKTVYWVRGHKKSCVGIAEMQCLQIYKGSNLENAQWKYFYDTIYGFEFEEGYLKKVILKKEHLDPKKVPADASSIRYTLIKELKKKKEESNVLNGKWLLTHLKGKNIVGSSNLPYIHFETSDQSVSGYDGCNQYFGGIKYVSDNQLRFSRLASTKMWCIDMSLAHVFLNTLEKVFFYRHDKDSLFLLDERETILLQFKRE